MSRLAVITPREMVAILKRLGFEEIRRRGSHAFFEHPDGRATVVPMHKGETLGRGLIRSILKDIEADVNDYKRLRKKG